MKAYHYILILVVYMILPQESVAQKKQDPSLLIGTWAFDYQASIKSQNPKFKMYYDTMSDARKRPIENGYRGRMVTFNKDGTYVQTQTDGQVFKSKWNPDRNHKFIEIVYPGGHSLLLKIKKLTASVLVLEPKAKGKSSMLIKDWHFTKN